MTIDAITILLFGKRVTCYRVFNNGEVVQVCCTKKEAQAWIAAAKVSA